jgi:hypothetical protein
MTGWRRLLRDLLDPEEFAHVDGIVIETLPVRFGGEVTRRTDYKLIERVIKAKQEEHRAAQ